MAPKVKHKGAKRKAPSGVHKLGDASDDEAAADAKDDIRADENVRDSDAKFASDAGGKGIISILRNDKGGGEGGGGVNNLTITATHHKLPHLSSSSPRT